MSAAWGRRTLVRWTVGLLAGAVTVWVVVNAVGGFTGAVDALGRVDPWWLVPAVAVEAASYVLLGVKLRDLVGRDRIGVAEGVEIGLVVSGFGLLTPASPAEGLAAAARHLRARGVPARRVGFAFGFAEWFSTRVFLLTSAVNVLVVIAIERDPLADLWPLLLAAVAVLAALAITARLALTPGAAARVAALAGGMRRRHRRRSVADRRAAGTAFHAEARAYIGSPRRRARLALLTAGAFLGDVGCLWFALVAGGAHVGFDVALLAVTTASFASIVPLVPGGIGIAEATIPAVAHHFGVPYEDGLAAALVYRALGTFLPAAIGAGAFVHLRHRANHPR